MLDGLAIRTITLLSVRLTGRRRQIGVPATTLHDAVHDLVVALRHFADGMADASVRWGSEPGGVFLQFSREYHGQTDSCGVVVQEFAQDNWISHAHWLPVRGATVFADVVPTRDLLDAFIGALDELSKQPKDDAGKIRDWGWLFPHREFAALRESAAVIPHESN